MAVAGGAIFVLIIVGTIVFGKRKGAASYSTRRPEMLRGPAASLTDHSKIGLGIKGFPAPGTFVLALFLLLIFVVYYFINYGYLASVWKFS
jgi:cytochrome c oxidase subunit I